MGQLGQVKSAVSMVEHVLKRIPRSAWQVYATDFAHKFAVSLSKSTENELGLFLLRYGEFNSAFAGCGLCLAGTAHLRRDIFGDVPAAQIASGILLALIDEYVDAERCNSTHRALCAQLIERTCKYFGWDSGVTIDKQQRDTSAVVAGCYAVTRNSSDAEFFRALGFHVASEMNGAIEFTILDRALRSKAPKLVKFLADQCGDGNGSAYRWISEHIVLEEVHFRAALDALTTAQGHYSGPKSASELDAALDGGVREFYQIASLLHERSVESHQLGK